MKKYFIVILLSCVLATSAQNSYSSFTYSVGFGMGDLGDFISKPSFRGFTIDYHKLVTPNVGVGIEAGWNLFYERMDYDTYTVDTYSLSGVQYRYNNQIPALINVNYILSPEKIVKPYAGLGIGTMYSERATDMGQWRLTEKAWHFALEPEVGILYEMNEGTHARIGLKYFTGFSAGDLDTQSYLALNVGFAFMK